METHSSASKRIIVVGVVVVVIGLVVASALAFEQPGTQAPSAAATTQPAAVSSPEPAASPTKPVASQAQAPANEAPGAAPQASQRPPLMPAELIAEVLKEDKKLALFKHYQDRVLLDETGRNEYRKVLSDPEIMKAMAEDLMAPGKGEVEPKEQYHRLMQIDYFDAALTWKENPQRQQVIELAGSIILTDNFSNAQDVDRRQMLAGGKMELYRLMYESDVSKALDLVAQAKGTRMEQLVNWMAEENLRRRAREEQIRAEIQEMQTQK